MQVTVNEIQCFPTSQLLCNFILRTTYILRVKELGKISSFNLVQGIT